MAHSVLNPLFVGFILCPFGWRLGWAQALGMSTQDNVHVPYAELALERRLFYRLAATASINCIRLYLAALQVDPDSISLSRVWDEYKFTPADAPEFFENTKRLEAFLVHFVVKDPRFWGPRLEARRRRRRTRR